MVAALAMMTAACADEVETDGPAWQEVSLPQPGPVAHRPWARAACDQVGADLLACVDGVAITRADYDRVRGAYASDTPAAQIIDALVTAEVLAAAGADLWGDWLTPELKRAMVQHHLSARFEGGYRAADVQDADIARAWFDWRVRIKFVREPSWFTTDAQFLCCSGDFRTCAMRPEVQDCIDKLEPQARGLYELLKADPPRSPLEMKGRVYAHEHLFPKAAVADVHFYFKPDVPYEEQAGHGYELMVKEFTMGVIKLKPGELSEPIRSPFGWHVVRLDKTDPGRTATVRDPEVREQIGEHLLPLLRKRDAQAYIFGLLQQRGVQISFATAARR